MNLVLKRLPEWSGDQGTPGKLFYEDSGNEHFICYTLELPDRDNERSFSRIPAGSYSVRHHSGFRYKNALRLERVPGRSAILIHAGNWAGDRRKDLRSCTRGCILTAESHARLLGQACGRDSRRALRKVMALKPTHIEILEDCTLEELGI